MIGVLPKWFQSPVASNKHMKQALFWRNKGLLKRRVKKSQEQEFHIDDNDNS